MEFNQLTTFIKVAQLLSFSNAGEALGYSQSAVSVHIQQLEKELDVVLFERIGRKVYLSEAGNLFLNEAIEIISQVERAKAKLKERETPSGRLRIGTVESLSTVVLPPILLEFHKKYPQVNSIVTNGTTTQLEKKLKNHQIDLLLTLDYPIYGGDWIKWFEKEEESVFVGSERCLKKLPKKPTLADILSVPFILTQGGASYRKELEIMLAVEEMTVQPQLEISNPETILQLLNQGFGLSFLPKFVIEHNHHLNSLQTIDYPVPSSNIKIQLVQHKNKQTTQAMKLFIDLFIENYQNK
ncbi:LysR family transcriptional regulator [Vagococcus sp.]|uniref:LysR family transcriptional regulator n=1 Tax=Vagococcus sp. TaxID=1933889 RepID=UPI003F98647F